MNVDKPLPTTEPACLMPDRLWKVAFGMDIWTAGEARHLRGCPHCRGRFSELVKVLHQPRVEAEALAPVLLLAVITHLARQRVARLPAPARWDTAPPRDLPRERLAFDDPHLGATLYLGTDGKHWLDLTHSVLPAGSLLRVRLGEEGGPAPTWARFALLCEGFASPIAHLLVDECLTEQPAPLAVDLVPSAAALSGQDVPALRSSFAAALRDDPAAVPAWRAWAAEELARPDLPPELRAALDEIARGDPPQQPVSAASLSTVRACPVETAADRLRRVG
jgi:hypothetical protein